MKANRSMLINALRVAAEAYTQSANGIDHERLAEQFRARAAAAARLAQDVANAAAIVLVDAPGAAARDEGSACR